jgi:hypothetical protein
VPRLPPMSSLSMQGQIWTFKFAVSSNALSPMMNSELRSADYTGVIRKSFVIDSAASTKKSFKLLTLLYRNNIQWKVPVTRGCD